jgi:hypothetical protein
MTDSFIKRPHAVFDSKEFENLEHVDVRILLLLIRKWNGFNNGNISLGTREAGRRCGCSHVTAVRALIRLQAASLITRIYKGHLVPEVGRPDVASKWQLNFVKEEKEGVCLK